jgi:hypothetical protein
MDAVRETSSLIAERAIALPEDSPVTFRRYRAPPPRSTAGYALLAAGLLWSSWGSVH